jgi:peptide/nickel transport system permease protein
VRPNTWSDRIITVILFVLYSLPSFFVGVLLLVYLTEGSDYEWLRIFPTGGFTTQGQEWFQWTTLQRAGDILWHAVLPVTTLTYASFASLSRYARSGLLEVIRADYVRTARAKGLPERTVILIHALRNGLIPVVTLLGSILPILFAGSIVVEYIFAVPGMGTYMIEAISGRDFTVLVSVSYISAILTLTGILLVDILYVLLDPRISFGKRG